MTQPRPKLAPRRDPGLIVGVNYECGMCGTRDKNLFTRCQNPGCPDGHDQPGRFPSYEPEVQSYTEQDVVFWRRAAIIMVFAFIMVSVFSCVARAENHGFDLTKPIPQWFESVRMPDTHISCCGLGDAYEADVWTKNPDGSYEVTITDGSAVAYPDGSTRAFIPNGTVVHVPMSKVNPPKDGNPTGHGVIFMLVSAGKIVNGPFCFILPPFGS